MRGSIPSFGNQCNGRLSTTKNCHFRQAIGQEMSIPRQPNEYGSIRYNLRVDWGAAHAAETTRVLQRVKDLFFASCEVFKLGQGLHKDNKKSGLDIILLNKTDKPNKATPSSFSTYFAPEALLEASSTGLSQNKFIGIRKVALQGIRAAVAHNIGFHY